MDWPELHWPSIAERVISGALLSSAAQPGNCPACPDCECVVSLTCGGEKAVAVSHTPSPAQEPVGGVPVFEAILATLLGMVVCRLFCSRRSVSTRNAEVRTDPEETSVQVAGTSGGKRRLVRKPMVSPDVSETSEKQ